MPEQSSQNAMSNDIRLLGSSLGRIIKEQAGTEAFELVEKIRHMAKERRSNGEETANELRDLILTLEIDDIMVLIQAFSNYFQLINIAEDLQRVRVLRVREFDGRLHESLDDAIRTLKESELDIDAVKRVMNQLRIRLVLTAHPSEAKREEVLVKLQHISEMMSLRDREKMLPREKRTLESQLAEEIEELWQTRPVRPTAKRVADEVNFGLYFLTSTIMDAVVKIYDDMYDSLGIHFPEEDWSGLPRFLRYGSWIGGDRDGNPNVTVDVTMQTLQTMREAARRVYLEDIRFVMDHLTQSAGTIGVSDELSEAIEAYEVDTTTYTDEPYRQFLNHIWNKLDRDEYIARKELEGDLRIMERSLLENKGKRVADGKLRRLIRKVRLFGLYIAPLDIREDAGLHAQTLDELLRHYGVTENYLDLTESGKQALLNREIANPRPFFPVDTSEFSEVTQRIVATWRMIATAHKKYSTGAIDAVIASMSKQPSDILTMLLFATEVGVQDDIDVVPLFETIDDLANAPEVMTVLFENPLYVEHLNQRAEFHGSRHQQIMIGYSDSSKDGGYLASNWNLYNAQQRLSDTCEKFDVSLELFHGRGGSIGRGGGPTNRSILSQPPKSLAGGIKITEQGEVIAYRYSNPDIARRHLQQVSNAGLLALGVAYEDEVKDSWRDVMTTLSETGRKHYRNFVYETEGFLEYWQQATPINELSQLRISSRPAKRSSKGGFAAMRAIPWVFSWMQSRAIVPSWFGVGTAFKAYSEQEGGLALMQEMYQEWSFFRAVVENAQLDVAKADMGIAELYSTLVYDESLRDEMFGRIKSEHELTCEMILAVTQRDELLDNTPSLKVSIERRNPYVDPLNFIQVELLRKLRAMQPDSPEYQPTLDAVLATINGIAAGMKTTG